MATTTAIPTEVDDAIIETFDNCIMKMSDALRKKFNPDEKESRSLFRLFCSAVNTRSKIMNKILCAIDNAHQYLSQSEQTIVKNVPTDNEHSSCITENQKKHRRGGAFWRNKKLA